MDAFKKINFPSTSDLINFLRDQTEHPAQYATSDELDEELILLNFKLNLYAICDSLGLKLSALASMASGKRQSARYKAYRTKVTAACIKNNLGVVPVFPKYFHKMTIYKLVRIAVVLDVPVDDLLFKNYHGKEIEELTSRIAKSHGQCS